MLKFGFVARLGRRRETLISPIDGVVHDVGVEEAGAVNVALHRKVHADSTLGDGRNRQDRLGQRVL